MQLKEILSQEQISQLENIKKGLPKQGKSISDNNVPADKKIPVPKKYKGVCHNGPEDVTVYGDSLTCYWDGSSSPDEGESCLDCVYYEGDEEQNKVLDLKQIKNDKRIKRYIKELQQKGF
jgi:hypothetical protein